MILKEAREIIEKDYPAFGFKLLDQQITLMDYAEQEGLDLAILTTAVKLIRKNRAAENPEIPEKHCPDCGKVMRAIQADSESFQFLCHKCRRSILIEKSYPSYVRELMKGVTNGRSNS